jgi:peptide/nickel transport system permease protein
MERSTPTIALSDPSVFGVVLRRLSSARALRLRPTILIAGTALLGVAILALLAPVVLSDPRALDPIHRLQPPSSDRWFGTDNLGRSVFVRTVYGTRVSLAVGLMVAFAATIVGVAIGLVAGSQRLLDGPIMRAMDGIMAIPGVLLAIALMSLFGSSLTNVVVAISVPEVPRMARLVRSTVLTLRELPFMEAAIATGSRLPRLLLRHLLPNVVAPVLVQATFVFASAMIVEAILSFLGAGTPPDVPSWGGMLSEARRFLQRAPWMIAFPGIALAGLVLLVNLLGDALRDTLDPRLARQFRARHVQ